MLELGSQLAIDGVANPVLQEMTGLIRHKLTKGAIDDAEYEAIKNILFEVAKQAPTLKDLESQKRWNASINNYIPNGRELSIQTATAAIIMTKADPHKVPSGLLNDAGLKESERQDFANYLMALRPKLARLSGFKEGIALAGSQETIQILGNLYQLVANEIKRSREGETQEDKERAYLEYLTRESFVRGNFGRYPQFTDAIPGVEKKPIELENIYVALNTMEKRVINTETGIENVPVSALRAVIQSKRVVILGDPGSGKSTFIQHLCLCLAKARLFGDQKWVERLSAGPSRDRDRWPADYPLPIFISLREFAHAQKEKRTILPHINKTRGLGGHLLEFIKSNLEQNGFDAFSQSLSDILSSGDAIVFLDGLDEVTAPSYRQIPMTDNQRRDQVAHVIHHFFDTLYPQVRAIITCRTAQYRPKDSWRRKLEEGEFHSVDLAGFEPSQQNDFIHTWYDELTQAGRLTKENSDNKQTKLRKQLETRDDLRILAENPLLLTQMAIIHTVDELPNSLVKVYLECIKLLLWQWAKIKAEQGQQRGETPEEFIQKLAQSVTPDDITYALDEAVFQAHSDGASRIPKKELLSVLKRLFLRFSNDKTEIKASAAAEKFVHQWLGERNGLFLPGRGDDDFDFPHRTFREFMAGRFLQQYGLPDNHIDATTQDHPEWEYSGPILLKTNWEKWVEVFRFAARLEQSDRKIITALNELYPSSLKEIRQLDGQVLFLMSEIMAEKKLSNYHRAESLSKRVINHLILFTRNSTEEKNYPDDVSSNAVGVSGDLRLKAGLALDNLGWSPTDLYEYKKIEKRLLPTDRHLSNPQHQISDTFWISKYPVTNLQYARFIASKDYSDDQLWQALKIFNAQGQPQSIGERAYRWFRTAQRDKKTLPRDWRDLRLGGDKGRQRLFPVVSLLWFEAAAYCAWLNRHYRDLPEASNWAREVNLEFRLPLEGEWTLAAGGIWGWESTLNRPNQAERPRYPWQKAEASVTASQSNNYANLSLNGSTPVYMYPAGASDPFGVIDMSGNISEWQANYYPNTQEPQFRGGVAWINTPDNMRISRCQHIGLEINNIGVGFRVVAVEKRA